MKSIGNNWGGELDSLSTRIDNKVSKSGDIINGRLNIFETSEVQLIAARDHNTTTSKPSTIAIAIGNNIPDGTAGSDYGRLILYGTGNEYTRVEPSNTSERQVITLPNASGTVALTTDLGAFVLVGEKAFTVEKTSSKTYAQGLAELKTQVTTYLANGNYFMPRSLNISGSVGLIASSGAFCTASSVEIRAFGWEPAQVEMFTIVDTSISKFVISSNSRTSLDNSIMSGNLWFRGLEYKAV